MKKNLNVLAIILFCLSSVSIFAASMGPIPPPDSSEMKCVGTKARKFCVGDHDSAIYDLVGRRAEVEHYQDIASDSVVRIFELNKGKSACWVTLKYSAARITDIRCVGM